MGQIAALMEAFALANPKLDIWQRYPDITEAEDEATDTWACGEVSAEFTEYARAQGWEAETVEAKATDPWADYHIWTELRRDGQVWAVDWTARQYHNLRAVGGRQPLVMNAPWPLVWDPNTSPCEHPLMGSFTYARKASA